MSTNHESKLSSKEQSYTKEFKDRIVDFIIKAEADLLRQCALCWNVSEELIAQWVLESKNK